MKEYQQLVSALSEKIAEVKILVSELYPGGNIALEYEIPKGFACMFPTNLKRISPSENLGSSTPVLHTPPQERAAGGISDDPRGSAADLEEKK